MPQNDGYIAVRLPEGLIAQVDILVEQKLFASRSQGCVALLTAGLASWRKNIKVAQLTPDQRENIIFNHSLREVEAYSWAECYPVVKQVGKEAIVVSIVDATNPKDEGLIFDEEIAVYYVAKPLGGLNPWDMFVGNQSVTEFMEVSTKHPAPWSNDEIVETAFRYAKDVPNMFPEYNHAYSIADIGRALTNYIQRSLK